eukprot:808497-Amphidinium_carterae.1
MRTAGLLSAMAGKVETQKEDTLCQNCALSCAEACATSKRPKPVVQAVWPELSDVVNYCWFTFQIYTCSVLCGKQFGMWPQNMPCFELN